MKLQSLNALTCALAITLLVAAVAGAQEAKIKFQDLPPAVQATAKAQSHDATVKGYTREIEHGKTEYEVQTVANGKTRDVSMDPEGKVIETETEVALASVPEKARAAIQKEAGNVKITKVEEVKSGQSTVYEAHIRTTAGKRHEIRVLEDGAKAPPES
jgi:uncharacterized membrane protein YkoI